MWRSDGSRNHRAGVGAVVQGVCSAAETVPQYLAMHREVEADPVELQQIPVELPM